MKPNIKEIKLTYITTIHHEVIISEENGYDMPESINQLVDMVQEMKFAPEVYDNSFDNETSKDIEFQSFDIVES